MVMLDHFRKEFKRKAVGLLQHAGKSGAECGPGTCACVARGPLAWAAGSATRVKALRAAIEG